jgi:V-type H+-transporting ATPase subunit H
LLDEQGVAYAELFLVLLSKLVVEEVRGYILNLIDEMLTTDPTRAKAFLSLREKNQNLPCGPFLSILRTEQNPNSVLIPKVLKIIAVLFSKGYRQVNEIDVTYFLKWCFLELRKDNENAVRDCLGCLQKLLVHDDYRVAFSSSEGLEVLNNLVRTNANSIQTVQTLYQAIYCLWLVAYNEQISEKINKLSVIPVLVNIARTSTKEKILRISFATLRNLLDKSTNNEQMIEGGALKLVLSLLNKNWGDPDIVEDLEALKDSLQKNMVVLSSLDVYKKELLSGKLQWSPVHRSEKFWRENAPRFEENAKQLLMALKEVFKVPGQDAISLAVACFDIGEFVRFHPRGKKIIQDLDVKTDILGLMSHGDPDVQKHALLAIQKLMVTNWEYLSSQ